MKSAVNDINSLGNQMTAENRKDILGLLFSGIIHIVTIPMLTQAVSEKVPLVGGLVNWVLRKILTLVADRIDFGDIAKRQATQLEEDNGQKRTALQIYTDSIIYATNGLNKVMNVSVTIVQFPISIVFGFTLFLLLLLLLLFIVG